MPATSERALRSPDVKRPRGEGGRARRRAAVEEQPQQRDCDQPAVAPRVFSASTLATRCHGGRSCSTISNPRRTRRAGAGRQVAGSERRETIESARRRHERTATRAVWVRAQGAGGASDVRRSGRPRIARSSRRSRVVRRRPPRRGSADWSPGLVTAASAPIDRCVGRSVTVVRVAAGCMRGGRRFGPRRWTAARGLGEQMHAEQSAATNAERPESACGCRRAISCEPQLLRRCGGPIRWVSSPSVRSRAAANRAPRTVRRRRAPSRRTPLGLQ